MSWLETYAKTHLFYIILIVGGVFSFRVWLQEHDARVAADNVAKQQEVLVADLKSQIEATQTQAAHKVLVVRKMVKKVTTPSQVVQTLPYLTDLPLNARPVQNDKVDVEVEAQPFLTLAEDDKTANIQLQACQSVSDLKDKQITAKNVEIVALKKKPRFFTRVKHVAEAVGVGIGIGLLLVK